MPSALISQEGSIPAAIAVSSNRAGPRKLSRRVELALAVSLTILLLIPCFWVQHIQAGDLSSHIYNAWLATQIRTGAVAGLQVERVWTNTLADYGLEVLLPLIGPDGAARALMSIAVMIFFWGVFSLVGETTGRPPWALVPAIAMLTWGLILHLGFLNFYLSTGLCSWAIAILWRHTWKRAAAAVALAVGGILAQPLPVAWAAAVLTYRYVSLRLAPHRVRWMLPAGAVAVVAIDGLIRTLFPTRSWLEDLRISAGLFGISGTEQVGLYGSRYVFLAASLLALWGLCLVQRIHQGNFLKDPLIQLWLLHMLAYTLFPFAIRFPQYQYVFGYVPQRVSMMAVILFFISVASVVRARGLGVCSAALAIVFFAFLYTDDRRFNARENQIAELVRTLPPGQRVVATIQDTDSRLTPSLHMIDRACIGHCFSYGNYEPATGQFRVRIIGPTQAVAPTMAIVQDIGAGVHTVATQEAPLFSLCLQTQGSALYLRALKAGERVCRIEMPLSQAIR